jgi:hypothetical protein
MVVRLFEWWGDLPDDAIDAIRSTVGWTRNDWMMMGGYFGVDPRLHGYDRVAHAYTYAYPSSVTALGWGDWLRWADSRVQQADWASVRVLIERSAAPLIAMIAIAAGYASRRAMAAMAALAVVFLTLCLGIEVAFKELPSRVLAPLQLTVVTAALIAAGWRRRVVSPVRAIVALGLTLAVLGPRLVETTATAASMARDAAALEKEVRALLRLSPSLVVLHADTFRREYWWRPFREPPIEMPSIALAWNNQNPYVRAYLARTGREDLLRAMCTDPSIVVIAEEGRLEFVTKFFHEHHGAQASWMRVYEASFPAWRCSLTAPPAP